jgi:ClpP class serine protease
MKNLPLIAGALYLEPWCIRGDVHAELSRQFREYLKAGGLGDRQAANDPAGPTRGYDRAGKPVFYHEQVEISADGKVAYRLCEGMVGKHISNFEMACFGGLDLAVLEQQLENVRDDPKVQTLVLNFNTPGGRAQGVEQVAMAIREVSEAGKLVIGYTDTLCCSAGYFLAAACDQFFAQEDAIVGSISTICAGVDSSRAWEMEGLELKLVATGELKGLGTPGKQWTEAEMKFLEERAQVVDDVFKGFVRDRRKLDDSAMNGAHWYARKAPAGVIDGHAKNIQQVLEAALMR